MSNTVDHLDLKIRLLDARLAQVEAKKTAAAIAGIGRSAKTTGAHTKASAKHMHLFDSALGGLRWTAGVAGLGSLAFGVKDVVNAGQEWQQQQAQLRLSLVNTHQAVTPGMARLNDQIERNSGHGALVRKRNRKASPSSCGSRAAQRRRSNTKRAPSTWRAARISPTRRQ